jgi:hypothetical protein
MGSNYKLTNDSATRDQFQRSKKVKNIVSIHAKVSTSKNVKKNKLNNCELYFVRRVQGKIIEVN